MKLKHKNFDSDVELNSTKAAFLLKKALPIKGKAHVWQEEIYFEVQVTDDSGPKTENVTKGDVAYWPPGKCFCVFFGNTQPVSAVTVIGKVKSNLEGFRGIRDGATVELIA
jgi:uncharacterized protein